MNTALLLVAAALLGCHDVPTYPARVDLEIDGEAHDYATSSAEWGQEGDGPISVYLLPDDRKSGQPYVNLRYYSGNPVGHLWVRYPEAGQDPHSAPEYECFVPGVLRDGTPTLGWTKPDGSERQRTETGEEDCHARVERVDDTLVLTFDARLLKDEKVKKDEEGVAIPGVRIHAEGSAVVEL